MAKTAAECVYDDQKVPFQTGFDPFYDTEDYSAGTRLGDAGSVELWVRTSGSGRFSGPPSPPGSPIMFTSAYSSPDSVQIATDGENTSGPFDGILYGQQIGSVDAIPPNFFLPFLYQSTFPDLRVNLSFLGEENLQVQVSETDATDTDMKSCVFG